MPELVVRDLEAFEAAIAQPRVLLFKHSPLCPVSSTARAEYELFRLDHPDAPTLFVDVVSSRAVARGIAEQCGVAHESPQAILVRGGKVLWNASHFDITTKALSEAVTANG